MTRPIRTGPGSRSGPSPAARPDRMRQNSTASTRRPTPPWPAWNIPPAGPVSSSANGPPWRARPVGDDVRDEASVVLRRQHRLPSDRAADVDAVHPGVAGVDDVEEVAEGPHPLSRQLRVVRGRAVLRAQRPPRRETARDRLVQRRPQLGGGEVGVLADLQGGQLGEPQFARTPGPIRRRGRSAGAELGGVGLHLDHPSRWPRMSRTVHPRAVGGAVPVEGVRTASSQLEQTRVLGLRQRHGLLVVEVRDVLDGGADHGGHLTPSAAVAARVEHAGR